MSTTRTGTTFYVLATLLFIALVSLLFARELERRRNPNGTPAAVAAGTVTLARNRYGHYVATCALDGHAAECLLDTGASEVAVSAAFADAIGLARGAPVAVMTANGSTEAWPTRIGEIRLGTLAATDVRATIVPRLTDGQVLLGMSFLGRFDFAQRGSVLTVGPAAAP